MSEHDPSPIRRRVTRRGLLRSAVAGGVATGGLATSVTAQGNGNGDGTSKGFPPDGITEYGDAVDLGEGRVRPFTTETPSGEPKYHGVEFDRSALEGLPSAAELDEDEGTYDDKYGPNGEALEVHRKQSLEFFVPFPDAAETPFTFLGLNWNPDGHPGGKGAWLVPHFDVHFHMLDTGTVDAIEGPALPPYDDPEATGEIPAERIPDGYVRSPEPVADERYITDMGEHTAPRDAPELPDGPDDDGNPDRFTATLIQGFVGVGASDADPRLAFVEPMLTREYLRDLDGTDVFDVPQPEVYPHDERHPRTYAIRDVPSAETVCVVLQEFEPVD
ncbi:hypothetical protein EI982_09100 [Haloplanus rallus]|uniref:DUF5602 domain-containing protein n=1 Tax=Haloplanus rallus TaxID=1816183 RepID=A0A6B9F972_9EURY|nr:MULTISPECIES: hypothetical protein [Haloplanus]QGX94934.1 hypothetical protein EI982_09100 [Haloplanus rallus]